MKCARCKHELPAEQLTLMRLDKTEKLTRSETRVFKKSLGGVEEQKSAYFCAKCKPLEVQERSQKK